MKNLYWVISLCILCIFPIYAFGVGSISGEGNERLTASYKTLVANYKNKVSLAKIKIFQDEENLNNFISGAVDFRLLSRPEQFKSSKRDVLFYPIFLDAVVVAYSIPGVNQVLNLSPEVIAQIFLGRIRFWDDSKIVKLNPKVKFPKDLAILPCIIKGNHDLTAQFSKYLGKSYKGWTGKMGTGSRLRVQVALGVGSSQSVAGVVRQNPGAIGYLSIYHSRKSGLATVQISDKKGAFWKANTKNLRKAAAQFGWESTGGHFGGAVNDQGYPMTFVNHLAFKKELNSEKKKTLRKFIKWTLTGGVKKIQKSHLISFDRKTRESLLKTWESQSP